MEKGNTAPAGEDRSPLTREDILRLARIRGLPIVESDVDEIRYRLNALTDALDQLDTTLLYQVDPTPLLIPPEE